jgi:hypothetical protein
MSPNRDTAERKFRALQKRLQQDNALRKIYKEQISDHVVKQVEIAPTTENSTGVFYLPHHVAKKERRGKIKWRIAFDASSSEGHRPSLNDVLEMGPNLLRVSDSTTFSRTSCGNNWRHTTSIPPTFAGP